MVAPSTMNPRRWIFRNSGRVSPRDFAEADRDREGTLSKDEYLALVERWFRAPGVDHEGTLTAKELNSPAGRVLLRLLK